MENVVESRICIISENENVQTINRRLTSKTAQKRKKVGIDGLSNMCRVLLQKHWMQLKSVSIHSHIQDQYFET